MDHEIEDDTFEPTTCDRIPEDRDGDDELKENGVDSPDDTRTKKRTRRVIRVEDPDEESTEVTRKPLRRLQRQSSSEDEVARNRKTSSSSERTRTPSNTERRSSRRIPSSSEDDVISPRRKGSRISVKDRTSSFEQTSESSREKRNSFASKKSHTVSTSGSMEKRRDRFSKSRSSTSDQENKSPRKNSTRKVSSDGRPAWSSSTKVEHERVLTHTVTRKESLSRKESTTTHSESDEPKSAAQIKAKWEQRVSRDTKVPNKTKAFGSSTGAAAMKAKFENQSSSIYKKRTSSNTDPKLRTLSRDSVDGEPQPVRHSAASLKARFEAKQTENTPVKRNFVINKGKSVAKKFGAGNTSNKCAVCNKPVYPMEKLEANGIVYHKFCFKCATCNRTVSLGNYAALEGKIYCKPHIKQLFKLKGNYDEGFGRTQRKADWVNKNSNAKSTTIESPEENSIPENKDETNGHDNVVNGHDAEVRDIEIEEEARQEVEVNGEE